MFPRSQFSTHIGALLTVGIAPAWGMPLPVAASQLLWVNIIMDGPPAMALGVDPTRPGIMSKPPRGLRERLLNGRLLIQLVGFGTIMALGTLAVLYFALETNNTTHAPLFAPYEKDALFMTTLASLYAFSCRPTSARC